MRLHHRIGPVKIIQLYLYKLRFRMLIQDLNQQFGRSVIGKTEVFYLPFRFLLYTPVEAVIFHIGIVIGPVLNGMQEVEIEKLTPGGRI